MARQDYAVRNGSKKKKNSNKGLLFAIAGLIVASFAGGLYLLKEKSPEVTQNIETVSVKEQKPKSQLPSRPEETWSYIKELESRTVTNNQSTQLSESQKAAMKRLEEEEKAKQVALAKLKQQQEEASAKVAQTQTPPPKTEQNTVVTVPTEKSPVEKNEATLKAEQAKAEKAKVEQERKAAEQKKLAEQRKEEQRKKAELAKAEQEKKAAKVETAKKEEPKKTETAKSTGKFGLQCGAFNDRAKAENLQARLAMSGLNARITESGKWNRVLIGPIGDRSAAVAAQQQASSIAGCVVIGM